jgi:4'-phosphopantetheinyl transferase
MSDNMSALRKARDDFPVLSQGELNIWHISTNISASEFIDLKSTLSKNESAKASFFEFDKARDAYVVGQSALRRLLSGYLGIPAEIVQLGRSKKGKPYSMDDPQLFFNMSNSGSLVAIAFSRDGEVGLDLEQLRPLSDLDDLITKNFTPSEIKFINSKPDDNIRRFFRFWTIKESYLKALGEGMRLPPDNLEFSIENDRVRLLSVRGIFDQADWNFEEFSIAPDYVGTITYARDHTVIKRMKFK